MCVVARFCSNLDGAAGVPIDPTAGLRCHLEGGRHIEEVPTAADFGEDALAMGAEQAQVGVSRGQESVDAHVALRDHRMEHAVHPTRRGQGRLVGRGVPAGAENVAVWAQHSQLFRAQYHVAIRAREERKRRAFVVVLFVTPVRAKELAERFFVQVECFE